MSPKVKFVRPSPPTTVYLNKQERERVEEARAKTKESKSAFIRRAVMKETDEQLSLSLLAKGGIGKP